MKRVLLLLGGLLISLSLGRASLIVSYVSQGSAGGGAKGGTVYTYDVDVESGTTVRTGDFFVIYDFGPVLAWTMPTGWSFVNPQPATGPKPAGIVPPVTSDTGILNAFIVRTGSDLSGPAFLGFSDLLFSLESPSPVLVDKTLNVGSQFHIGAAGRGDLRDLPVPEQAPVPEPGTISLMGVGLLSVGLIVRNRKA